MLREVPADRGLGGGELGVRHPAVEIAIEAQQQVDVVERQPHDRADGAAIDGKLGVADAVGVRAHSHRRKRDRRSGPEDASHVAFLTSYFVLRTSYFPSSYSPRGTIAM